MARKVIHLPQPDRILQRRASNGGVSGVVRNAVQALLLERAPMRHEHASSDVRCQPSSLPLPIADGRCVSC